MLSNNQEMGLSPPFLLRCSFLLKPNKKGRFEKVSFTYELLKLLDPNLEIRTLCECPLEGSNTTCVISLGLVGIFKALPRNTT